MSKFDPAAPITIGTPPAITQRDISRAESVIEEVIKLDRSMVANAFEMGDLFAEVVDGDYFHADHCQSLEDFLKKHKFQVSKREIIYRVKNSKVAKKLGISRELLMKAGISKVKAIFQISPDQPVEKCSTEVTGNMPDIMRALIVDAGLNLTLTQVKKQVEDLLPPGVADENTLVWMHLPTFKAQKEFIEDVIELAKSLAGDTVDTTNKKAVDISTAVAIGLIMADFKADPNNQEERGEQGTFQDELFVEDEDGKQHETGA